MSASAVGRAAYLILGFAASLAALAFPGSASAVSATITADCSSGGTTVASVAVGDRVSITVTLHSTDPNENGEGEPFIKTTPAAGGPVTQTFTVYEQPLTFSFVAAAPGPISGCFQGADGDESADVDVQANVPQSQWFTQAQKDRWNKTSSNLNIGAAAAATVAASCLAVPEGPVSKGCAIGAGVVSGLLWLGSGVLNRFALDPPDPNYRVIAQPTPPSLAGQPFVADAQLTQQEASAANALATNEEQAIALGRAILTSIDRASGARDAGDVGWETRQVQAARGYARQMSPLLAAQPGLLANMRAALQGAGVTRTLTVSDVASFESGVSAGGLPSFLIDTLSQLGADSATVDQIKRLSVVQDQAAVAALGGGGFPDLLTDPSLANSLQDAAAALNEFASAPPSAPNLQTTIPSPQVIRAGPTTATVPGRISLRSLRHSKCVLVRTRSSAPARVLVTIFSGRRSVRLFGHRLVRFTRPGQRDVCIAVPFRAHTFNLRTLLRVALGYGLGATPRPGQPKTQPTIRRIPLVP